MLFGATPDGCYSSHMLIRFRRLLLTADETSQLKEKYGNQK